MALTIMTTHRLKFRHQGKEWESKGRSQVEQAPDFIKNDPFFGMNKNNGRLVEFGTVKKPKPAPKPEAPPAPPEPDEEESTPSVRENKTTSRELVALNAKELIAAVGSLEDLGVLKNAKELEQEKKQPRKTVVEALDERINALEAEILTNG